MIIFYQKRFLKDLADIPMRLRRKIENFVFIKLSTLKKFNELKEAERMTGYPHYYKIRFGDYRSGLSFIDENITIERILHRKEIYRFFPWPFYERN
ncbi:MAG: type II toxin-antitoxin system RelE/ParE family toxin [Bacteroidota bacterium]